MKRTFKEDCEYIKYIPTIDTVYTMNNESKNNNLNAKIDFDTLSSMKIYLKSINVNFCDVPDEYIPSLYHKMSIQEILNLRKFSSQSDSLYNLLNSQNKQIEILTNHLNNITYPHVPNSQSPNPIQRTPIQPIIHEQRYKRPHVFVNNELNKKQKMSDNFNVSSF